MRDGRCARRNRQLAELSPLVDRSRSLLASLSVVVLAACAGAGASQEASRSRAAPDLEALRAATYRGLGEPAGEFTLEDGRWEGQPYVPGGASRPSVVLAGDFRLAGDLDGDGTEEAAVVLAQSSGGSGVRSYLAVVGHAGAGVRNLATTPLGDRVQIRGAQIADGRIVLAGVRAGPSDAACCPGELVRWTYRLVPGAGSLALDAEQVEGRLTPEALSGAAWRLQAWDLQEPVDEPLDITLSYADGQFFGTSACNRYAAGVAAGRAPGDIEVGPPRGTRMACPEPAMSAETRFLEQLAATRKFGFVLGRLALTYERESGIGLMLFDPAAGP